ncbi:MAG: zf-HC2 domain-containing protein [Deltaproteobacteria bacterium]|jgi:anti-sigma factor RsiW|nr:zf-HC2 domain-containing protein [Deltaproteobacteria bacterium]MBW2531045.1 zf-HC2 domain-containing protein [Deltaproteobacteria bacterium]
MRCHEVEAKLMRFVDDRLIAAEARKVDAHLDVCPRCRRIYADEVELCAAFHAEGLDPAGEELMQGVMDRVRAVDEARAASPAPVVAIRPTAVALLGAAAAVALLALWGMGSPTLEGWTGAPWARGLAEQLGTPVRSALSSLGAAGTLLDDTAARAASWMRTASEAAGASAGGQSVSWAAACAAALVVCVGLVSKVRTGWTEERRS